MDYVDPHAIHEFTFPKSPHIPDQSYNRQIYYPSQERYIDVYLKRRIILGSGMVILSMLW